MPDILEPYAKAIVAFVIVVLGGGIAQGLIVGAPAAWLTIVLGALATGGVYTVRNTPNA